jgi:hypothetical protein
LTVLVRTEVPGIGPSSFNARSSLYLTVLPAAFVALALVSQVSGKDMCCLLPHDDVQACGPVWANGGPRDAHHPLELEPCSVLAK